MPNDSGAGCMVLEIYNRMENGPGLRDIRICRRWHLDSRNANFKRSLLQSGNIEVIKMKTT